MRKMNKKLLIGVLSFSALACMCFAPAATTEASAATPTADDLIMVNGASVRYMVEGEATDYSGIRFAAHVKQDYRTANAANEIGMLIIPTELLGANELTAEVEGVTKAKAEIFVAPAANDELYKEGYDVFKTVLYDIPEEYYGKQISARAYVKEGEDYIEMGETQVRSMAQVAWTAAQLPENSAKVSELNAYLAGVEITAPETLALAQDGEQTLGATVNYVGVTPKYESSNENVATVDKDGKVTAVGGGTATITTSVGAVEKETTVTVAANPIAPTDPEGTFWSFEDGNAHPNSSVDQAESGGSGDLKTVVENVGETTHSLKMTFNNWGGWQGFKNAATAAVPTSNTNQIVVRLKTEIAVTVDTQWITFNNGIRATGIKIDGVDSGTSLVTTGEWQLITFTFAENIESITGFAFAVKQLGASNAIYFDYFAFVSAEIDDTITDPEGTFWSFEDGNAHPNSSVDQGESGGSGDLKTVVENVGETTHSLKMTFNNWGGWQGFKNAATAAVPTSNTNQIVVRLKTEIAVTIDTQWITFNNGIRATGIKIDGVDSGTSLVTTGEWQLITFTFAENIESITGFAFAVKQLGASNAIYFDYFAFV